MPRPAAAQSPASLAAPAAPASTQLTAKELQQQPYAEVEKSRPVRLSGFVSFSWPGWRGFFLQDASGGIYCEMLDSTTRPAIGDHVEIEGFMFPSYRTSIRATTLRSFGPAPPPAAPLHTLEELWSGRHDSDLVRVRGTIGSVLRLGEETVFRVRQGSREIEVKMYGPFRKELEDLQFSEVEARGTVATVAGPEENIRSIALWLSSPADLQQRRSSEEVLAALPLVPLSKLVLDRSMPPGTLARTRGHVSQAHDGGFWISEEGTALLVKVTRGRGAAPDQMAEVVGFFQQDAEAPLLSPAQLVSVAAGPPPRAIPLAADELDNWRWHGTKAIVEATVLARTPTTLGTLLLLEENGRHFQARLKYTNAISTAIRPGARLRLTGMLFLERLAGEPDPMPRILVRTAGDLRILRAAPWPLHKTLAVVTGLSAALGAGLILVGLGYFWLRRAHRAALDTLADREQHLKNSQTLASLGSWDWDIASGVNTWSDENFRIFGYQPGAVQSSYDLFAAALHPEDRERVLNAARAAVDEGVPYDLECRILRPSGELRHLHCRGEVARSPKGDPLRMAGTVLDITERRRLETQVRQAQKMEALGTLSGGIAHDFNNILGAILGNVELASLETPRAHPATENLNEIRKASLRAKNLVQQILAFSRQQSPQRQRVQLGPLVDEAVRLLRATLPTTVELTWQIDPATPAVLADGTQMHQVLLNLGTNAWHALENDRGRIEIRLRGAVLDTEAAARIPGAKSGPVAWLSISDSGHGMPPGMIDRIFDPFFTTKEPGKGTGLGLSVVHGIMETHEGAIHVISTVGQGTTFHLYFPAAGPLANPRAASSSHRPPRDPRTVEPVAAPVRTAGSRG